MSELKRTWPGNECDCQDKENKYVHDYLCDILSNEMNYTESDVCTASVGMWGAIHLMRLKLDAERRHSRMLEVQIKEQDELIERQSELLKRCKEFRDDKAN